MSPLVIVAIVIGLPVLFFIFTYNSLVSARNMVNTSFSTIDVMLKKRYDLIPNLVATVKGYAKHESEVLQKVTELRKQAMSSGHDPDRAVHLNNRMGQLLAGLMVRVESYPQLKANENFLRLQASLNEVEEQLAAARRAFNAAIKDYNNLVQMFPTNMVASMAGFRTRQFFHIPKVERKNPKAEFGR